MKQKLRANPQDLLTCFFSECERQFRFLELRHGYSYLSGLATYKNNYKIIIPYNNTTVPEPFLAVTRYERDNLAFEFLYGYEDFVIEVNLYINNITRLSLKDLMDASRVPYVFEKSLSWVTYEGYIEEALGKFAAAIRENEKKFLSPSDKLIERALTMRGKLMEQAVREQYKTALHEASVRAAQAYMRKDYALVVEILQPFERDLSKADLKKLKLAREALV